MFFIFYIIVCSFFILNLFVGVVFSTYKREEAKLGKNFLLTESQKKWLEVKLLVIEAKPKFYIRRPRAASTSFRVKVFQVVEDSWVDTKLQFTSKNCLLIYLFGASSSNSCPQGEKKERKDCKCSLRIVFGFEQFIMICILLNTMILTVKWYD